MSAGNINWLLMLWSASLAIYNGKPLFMNAARIYNAIDSTPLGDVPWETFSLHRSTIGREGDFPSWMEADYDVWFRNPRTLVHNLLSNLDFKSGFDFTPFQERTADGTHRFCDFMSANWAWKQAVSLQRRLI